MKAAITQVFFLKVLNQILALVVSIGIARFFGEYNLGKFALFNAAIGLFIVLSSLGSNVLIQKEISGEENRQQIQSKFNTVLIFRTINVSFILLFLFLYNILMSPLTWIEFTFLALIAVIMQFFSYIAFFLKAKSKFFLAELYEWTLFRIAIFIGVIAAIYSQEIAYLYLFIACFIFVLFLTLLRYLNKNHHHLLELNTITKQIKKHKYTEVFKSAFPYFITQLTGIVLIYTDTISIIILQGYEKLALYDVSYKLSTVILFLNSAVSSVLSTRVSHDYKTGNVLHIRKTVTLISFASIIFSMVVFTMAMLWGKLLLSFWGSGFSSSNTAFIILLLGTLTQFSFSSMSVFLAMTDQAKLCAKISILFAVFNLFATPIFTYFFDINGAACATSISLGGIAIVSFYYFLQWNKS